MREAKHNTVMRLLRSRILRGIYNDRLPGEVQLAKEMGVSTVTLGHALMRLEAIGLIRRRWRSGTFVVPQEEREKVSAPVTVLLSQMSPPSIAVSVAFGTAAQAHGMEMTIALHPGEETDQAVHEILVRLGNVNCVGAAIVSTPLDSARALRLASGTGPAVLVDWETPDLILPTITFDDFEAGRLAAAHLLNLGHRRIAFVDPLPSDPIRTARSNGVAELVRRTGGWFHEKRAPDFGWGVPACIDLLRPPDRPTAIVCGVSFTALDMAKAAESLGLSVPGDLSLVSMGNQGFSKRWKTYTHIAFDEEALGSQALDLLLDSTPGGEPRRARVPVQFVDRGTTAPPGEQP